MKDSIFFERPKTFMGDRFLRVCEMTSASAMRKYFPASYMRVMADIRRKRALAEDSAKITSHGRCIGRTMGGSMMLRAAFPTEVHMILLEYAPEILYDGKEFDRWLRKCPEWAIGKTTDLTASRRSPRFEILNTAAPGIA